MSKINDIKNLKRKQKVISPTQALSEIIKDTSSNDQQGGDQSKKIERKRVSFDLRIDLHKELKMQALIQEKNIYNLIEEALEITITFLGLTITFLGLTITFFFCVIILKKLNITKKTFVIVRGLS